jgi:asparaginyl-tRNA synthetase
MSIAALLNDKTKINKTVSVEGWVRTRRDSKAGMSFIALYDGS